MVSSRDRNSSVSRCTWLRYIARTPPPAFLFPNQRCQRPDRLSPAPLFSAGGRRRRLSSGRPLSCQSVLSTFSPHAGPRSLRKSGAKITPGRRGASLIQSVAIRLRLGKISIVREKSKGFSAPFPNRLELAPPEREALSRGRGPATPVNRRLSDGAKFALVRAPCLARGRAAPLKKDAAGGGAAMLSQKASYALRALVELARAEGAQLTAGELAAARRRAAQVPGSHPAGAVAQPPGDQPARQVRRLYPGPRPPPRSASPR